MSPRAGSAASRLLENNCMIKKVLWFYMFHNTSYANDAASAAAPFAASAAGCAQGAAASSLRTTSAMTTA